MKIYVASSWRNRYQPSSSSCSEAGGMTSYDFRNPPNESGLGWEEVAQDWESWSTDQYMEALAHPLAEDGYDSDFRAMQDCDALVMVMPVAVPRIWKRDGPSETASPSLSCSWSFPSLS